MSVRWDALLVASLAREMRDRLEGERLRAIHLDRDRRNLLLHFRAGTLVIRLHPRGSGLAWLPPAEPAPGAHRFPARLRDVVAPADDRLVVFSFTRIRGRGPAVQVVVELRPNQANAFVLEGPDRRIRANLRKSTRGGRELDTGEAYRFPPPSKREGISQPVTLDRWLTCILT